LAFSWGQPYRRPRAEAMLSGLGPPERSRASGGQCAGGTRNAEDEPERPGDGLGHPLRGKEGGVAGVNRGEQLGQAFADPSVGPLGRLVQETLEVADVVARGREHLQRGYGGPDAEPEFDGVGLGDDADVVDDGVPQLPDDAQRLVALLLG